MSDNEKKWGFLPDEILTHAYFPLPTYQIHHCLHSVSKTRKSLIKNPTFISTHLRHSHKNLLLFRLPIQPFEMFGTIPTGDREVYTLHDDDDFTEEQHRRLDFPFHGPDLESYCSVFRVVGTCDGLLCLSDDLFTYIDIFYLRNPCVRKILQLPYPNVTFDTHGGFDASLGLGILAFREC